jgi:hypothetical protein
MWDDVVPSRRAASVTGTMTMLDPPVPQSDRGDVAGGWSSWPSSRTSSLSAASELQANAKSPHA